jgi:hypothetical protein
MPRRASAAARPRSSSSPRRNRYPASRSSKSE